MRRPAATLLPMTQTPAAASTPLPTVPGQSLELTPGSAPTPVQGAAAEAVRWTGKLPVGPADLSRQRTEYDLVPVLSALDMVVLQEAQDSGKFREIIQAIQQLVPKPQREALVGQLLGDPDDALDRITLDDCLEILANGMEQIAARPTAK